MSRQNHFRPHSGKAGGDNRGPKIASVMAVDDLDALAARQFCRAQNQSKLEQPFRRRGMKGNGQLVRVPRELASIRAGEPNLLIELAQAASELHALVIGAAAFEKRVELQDAA